MSQPTTPELQAQAAPRFETFEAFFPFYLGEHSSKLNRWMHFVGTTSGVLILLNALLTGAYLSALWAPVAGYGMAWIGHFFVEKNKPASFQYPLWSFMGDFKMYYWMVTGRV